MKQSELSFVNDNDIRVRFKLDGFDDEFYGVLKFRCNRNVRLEWDNFSNSQYMYIKLSEREKKKFVCKSDSDTYYLYDSDCYGVDIWPTYIVKGHDDVDYYGVDVVISGVSEWIDQRTKFEISNEIIQKKIPEKAFSEIVVYDGVSYKVESNYSCYVSRESSRIHLCSEITSISMMNVMGSVSVSTAKELCYKLVSLFSLLLMSQLSILNVRLIDKSGKRSGELLFAAFSSEKVDLNSMRECLVQPDFIANSIGWKTLLTNYFLTENSHRFNQFWSRIPMFIKYTGTWEHEILGCVSVLDAYCSYYADKKSTKLPKRLYKDLIADLDNVIDKYSSASDLEQTSVLESIRKGVLSIRNSSLPTFKEKYEFLLGDIDEPIKKIINFSDCHFADVKRIRDGSAHCLEIKTLVKGNVTYEIAIKNKVLVLLCYLYLKDLGFDDLCFAKIISSTVANVVRESAINRAEADRLIGDALFISVDESTFTLASERGNHFTCLAYSNKNNTYTFSHEMTECSKRFMLVRERGNIVDYIKNNLFHEQSVMVEYHSKVYLENSGRTLCCYSVCVASM
ncbi:hypothetical protein GBN24_07830 [Plesiomonas shigelloides]|uniref:hypothetical protein n=1 Tax=Plesiomonas shigelloides TaxID=703 RepID=UPI0012625CF3|nr:hypothetical protein [Plesiomonas shigelloides]KAB7691076.1 hypothetical protein GBN24_07830 [Plesiomonas shigelloides]